MTAFQAAPSITLRGVIKSYKTPAGDFFALQGIDAEIYPGEFVGILGKSGAGKSTLVNMITGVDHLTAGEIWVGGVAVHKLNENQAAQWRSRSLGVVYQSFQLMPTLSLLDNIMLPMDFSGGYRPRRSREIAHTLLTEVELDERVITLALKNVKAESQLRAPLLRLRPGRYSSGGADFF